MPTPTCVSCERPLITSKMGILLVEMFLNPPVPYQAWSADVASCTSCGREIVYGYAAKPEMIHFQGDMPAWIESQKLKGRRVVYQHER